MDNNQGEIKRKLASIQKRKKYKAEYFQKNRERIYARIKVDKDKNPEKYKINTRNYGLKYLYGLTLEEFDAFYIVQKGKCWICEKNFSKNKRADNPVVDHNHKTGNIRGLLCWKCNIALGHFDDNIELLRNAVKYLE